MLTFLFWIFICNIAQLTLFDSHILMALVLYVVTILQDINDEITKIRRQNKG
jgi:hypothetical protein